MTFQATVVRIFVASPSDVTDERAAVVQEIRDWNAAHAHETDLILEPVRWETHATPEMGERPQAIINRQLVRQCDILIGIFWTRLGTPTGEAQSGTIEEIRDFERAGKPVLLYFSDREVSPRKIDQDQYERLQAFRVDCEERGLISGFESVPELREQLGRHLPSAIRQVPIPRGSREILVPENPRTSVVYGVSLVKQAVERAFGPYGERVSVRLSGNEQQLSRQRGASIAAGIRSQDEYEAAGIGKMQDLTGQLLDSIGDYTKTSVLLADTLLQDGNEAISRFDRSAVFDGMRQAYNMAGSHLRELARAHENEETVRYVAETACQDDELAEIVIEGVRRAGPDGVVTVERHLNGKPHLDVEEGFRVSRGLISPDFINDPDNNRCVLDDPYLLICDQDITSYPEIVPLLDTVAQAGRSLLIIAATVDGEALATLNVNASRKTVSVAAIRAPARGRERREILEDIAVATGGHFMSQERGEVVQDAHIEDLGEAEQVVADSSTTTIQGGRGAEEQIDDRARQLRRAIDDAGDPLAVQRLKERVAALVGQVVVITAAGRTDADAVDTQYRIASSLFSVRSSIESGWLPGGGSSLLDCINVIEQEIGVEDGDPASVAGARAVANCLATPAECLARSAGIEWGAVYEELLDGSPNLVLDVTEAAIREAESAGIADSAPGVRECFDLAFAHAMDVLKTGDWQFG